MLICFSKRVMAGRLFWANLAQRGHNAPGSFGNNKISRPSGVSLPPLRSNTSSSLRKSNGDYSSGARRTGRRLTIPERIRSSIAART